MLILLRRHGAVVEDVPIPARYGEETSHLSVHRALLEFPWLLLRHGLRRILWQYFIADFSAVSLFLISGVPLVMYGLVFGRHSHARGVAALLGFQFLLQALVLDVQSVPRQPLQAGSRFRARFTRV